LHAHYAWEAVDFADSFRRRLHPKIGVSRANFEETVPLTGTLSDAAFAPSFGVEWGEPRWGLVFDVSWTFVDIELIPGRKESINLSAGFLGLLSVSRAPISPRDGN